MKLTKQVVDIKNALINEKMKRLTQKLATIAEATEEEERTSKLAKGRKDSDTLETKETLQTEIDRLILEVDAYKRRIHQDKIALVVLGD